MWKVCGVLRKSFGENIAEWRKGSETIENGGAVDFIEKSLSSFIATRDTGSLFEWHLSGGKLRWKYDNRGISFDAKSGDWLS